MRAVMDITKALADENRVRILMFLQESELCVCQIVEMLGLAPSTVSKHVAVLHQAGLLESRKAGRWVYYRLPDVASGDLPSADAASADAGPSAAGAAIAWLRECLCEDPRVLADRARLRSVLGMDRELLCVRYRKAEKGPVTASHA